MDTELQNNSYSIETKNITYNNLNQILKMTKTTTENSGALVTTETDIANRKYNSQGQLAYSKTTVAETGYSTKTIETTIDDPNNSTDGYYAYGNLVKSEKVIITDATANTVTTQTDQVGTYSSSSGTWTWATLPRLYDAQGRLVQSSVRSQVKTNGTLTSDTFNYTYNSPADITVLGRDLIVFTVHEDVLYPTDKTKNTATYDAAPRRYDSTGRLVATSEVVINLDLTNTQICAAINHKIALR